MRQITDETSKRKGRYENEKSCAIVKARRVENYSDELYQILDEYESEIAPLMVGCNKTSSEKTMGIEWARKSTSRLQNRMTHQDMVEGVAVECAKKIGLNVGLTRLIARHHDKGHMFYGHSGERWLSEVKEKYGLGVYTHNSVGAKELIYRERIYSRILEEIKFFNPNIGEAELKRIKDSLWVIFDGINSHNGELSELEFRPNLEKTNINFLDELLMCHTEKGFDKKISPATIEGCLIRDCDKMAYIPFDMLDGLYEGIIDRIDGDYIDVLRALGITRTEIEEANDRKQYERIARKLQIIFAKSLIEHSSKDIITMDPVICMNMHQLRNVNNKRVMDFAVLQDEKKIIPGTIETLMEHFGEFIEREIGDVEDLRCANTNKSIARYLLDKYQGTPDEDFCRFISGTTPEIYDFNEVMLETVEMNDEISGKKQDLSFKRRMALEFGAEYLSTLNDSEFLNLALGQKVITNAQLSSLTRKYRDIGKERLIREKYISREWREVSEAQARDTREMGR